MLKRVVPHDALLTYDTATVCPTYTRSDVDLFLECETSELWIIISICRSEYSQTRGKALKKEKTLGFNGNTEHERTM
jgi:hypothetical protein